MRISETYEIQQPLPLPTMYFLEMRKESVTLLYNPLILITQLNKSFSQNEEGVLSGSLIDKYGICWNFVNDINDF